MFLDIDKSAVSLYNAFANCLKIDKDIGIDRTMWCHCKEQIEASQLKFSLLYK